MKRKVAVRQAVRRQSGRHVVSGSDDGDDNCLTLAGGLLGLGVGAGGDSAVGGYWARIDYRWDLRFLFDGRMALVGPSGRSLVLGIVAGCAHCLVQSAKAISRADLQSETRGSTTSRAGATVYATASSPRRLRWRSCCCPGQGLLGPQLEASNGGFFPAFGPSPRF